MNLQSSKQHSRSKSAQPATKVKKKSPYILASVYMCVCVCVCMFGEGRTINTMFMLIERKLQ